MSSRASIAIVGSGPAGCYTAQYLRKLLSEAEITVFDRLPVPYGLVRYGVAPDHVGTKAVTAQFDRLFQRGGVRLVGNVNIGTTVSLDRLRAAFDVVVVATGLSGDVPLAIDGAQLPGVLGAGRFTRTVNEHPDELEPLPDLGRDVVVVGHGNVAVDIVRLIINTAEDFRDSELGEDVLEAAVASVSRIEVVGRSAAQDAKFDDVMIKELSRISGVAFEIHHHATTGAPSVPREVIDDLAALPTPESPRVVVSFRFGLSPVRLEGTERVTGMRFASPSGHTIDLAADTVVTAIGFAARPGDLATNLPAEPGLYRVGWAARGPRGTIPENRVDGKATAEAIAQWLSDQPESDKPGYLEVAPLLADDAIDFTQWSAVDDHEKSTASPQRSRRKLRHRDSILTLARSAERTTS